MPYADPLPEDELAAALSGLPEWNHEDDRISRTTTTHDFREAIELIVSVAEAAEAAGHHPDIHLTGYRRVTFELSTHAVKAITRRDVELAARIDRLILGDR